MARKDASTPDEVPHTRSEPRPDSLSRPPPAQPLPRDLQSVVDRSDSLFDSIYDGTSPDSTTSSVRYAAYATRLRTILLSAQRYVAYTSDIGESFRPVAHPHLIRGAYAVSWAYLAGDVGNEGYKAYVKNQRLQAHDGVAVPPIEDYRAVMAQRAVFQGLASMGLPAFTIHSIVRYSGRALKDAANKNVRTWAPIGLGLAAVPFLPFVFDQPVEEAVEWTFHKAFATIGGQAAVAGASPTGREAELQVDARAASRKLKDKAKEKEL